MESFTLNTTCNSTPCSGTGSGSTTETALANACDDLAESLDKAGCGDRAEKLRALADQIREL